MVRVNLINPKKLSDQHLIAEYNEILMLEAYIKKYPEINKEETPKDYCLGKGHMKFFKNKLNYLEKRHKELKKEMKARGFKTNKSVDVVLCGKENKKNWKPKDKDFKIIKKRIKEKIELKPGFYRYFGKKKPKDFFKGLLDG